MIPLLAAIVLAGAAGAGPVLVSDACGNDTTDNSRDSRCAMDAVEKKLATRTRPKELKVCVSYPPRRPPRGVGHGGVVVLLYDCLQRKRRVQLMHGLVWKKLRGKGLDFGLSLECYTLEGIKSTDNSSSSSYFYIQSLILIVRSSSDKEVNTCRDTLPGKTCTRIAVNTIKSSQMYHERHRRKESLGARFSILLRR